MFDVGLTDTVVHALDECEEKNLNDLNSGGSQLKCGVKAFLHGAVIGLMDGMVVFGTVMMVIGLVASRKGKAWGLVDK